LSDDTEQRFHLVVTLFGGKKGHLSNTIEEAVKEWLDKHAFADKITKLVVEQQTPRQKHRLA
jgi:hypothetical protein